LKVVRSKIQDLFFRDPCLETAEVMEILKESNIVRDALFSNSMLRDHVKKEVGSDLSYRRSYLKKKIFAPEMKRACIEEFAKHLFGTRACFEGELLRSAASLRYFRDTSFRGWSAKINQSETARSEYFATHLQSQLVVTLLPSW
jgi:hypothetical protein